MDNLFQIGSHTCELFAKTMNQLPLVTSKTTDVHHRNADRNSTFFASISLLAAAILTTSITAPTRSLFLPGNWAQIEKNGALATTFAELPAKKNVVSQCPEIAATKQYH